MVPALLISKEKVETDRALLEGGRGARKIVVTSLFPEKECETRDILWKPPVLQTEKCPVLRADNYEMAIFNQVVPQDKHYHKKGTEIYTLLEGEMDIEVAEEMYHLIKGDSVIINPNTVHLVKRNKQFLCQVVTVNCGGIEDKFIV